MSGPSAVDTSALLAELFQHYEKSCFVLAQLEHSLKDRDGSMPGPVGLGPAEAPAALSDDEDINTYEEVDEFVQDAQDSPSEPRSQPLGLIPIAHLQPEADAADGDDDFSVPSRGASIIDMSAVAPSIRRLPRRAASLYSLGSARLQPSLSLNRRAPPDAARPPQHLHPQHLPIPVEAPRTSPTNLGTCASGMLHLSNEQLARVRPPPAGGGGAESPKSPLPRSSSSSSFSSSLLPDLLVHQLRGAQSQPQQVPQPCGLSRFTHTLRENDFLCSSAAQELSAAAAAAAQQQPLAQAPGGDGFSRHRSLRRRASCYIFSPLGSSSFNAAQQPQPQQQGLGAPAARSATSACASPVLVPLAAPASPAAPPAGGAFSSQALRRSSSSALLLALRPSSRGHGQPCWGTMDSPPDGAATAAAAPVAHIRTSAEQAFSADVQEEKETFTEGASTGFPSAPSSPAAAGLLLVAAASPGGSPSLRVTGGPLPPVKLRAPPARTRSYSIYGSGSQGQVSWPLSNTVRAAAAAAASQRGGTATG